MSEVTDVVSATASVLSALATCVAAAGVWYARSQLQTSREIAQLQFEDALAKEYRELASRIPTKVFIGKPLDDQEYSEAFDELYRYLDLTNEQISLRRRGRVGLEVWRSWREGIAFNMSLAPFQRAWQEIKTSTDSFQELRRLEQEHFQSEPVDWR